VLFLTICQMMGQIVQSHAINTINITTATGNSNNKNNNFSGSNNTSNDDDGTNFIMKLFEQLNILMNKSIATSTIPTEAADPLFYTSLTILYYQCSVRYIDIINTHNNLSTGIVYYLHNIMEQHVTASRPVEFVSLLICTLDHLQPQAIATGYVQRCIACMNQLDEILTSPSSSMQCK